MCTICVNNMYFIINDTIYKVYENLFRANPLYFFIEKADADANADANAEKNKANHGGNRPKRKLSKKHNRKV